VRQPTVSALSLVPRPLSTRSGLPLLPLQRLQFNHANCVITSDIALSIVYNYMEPL
jgi:hypothetical protein